MGWPLLSVEALTHAWSRYAESGSWEHLMEDAKPSKEGKTGDMRAGDFDITEERESDVEGESVDLGSAVDMRAAVKARRARQRGGR